MKLTNAGISINVKRTVRQCERVQHEKNGDWK